MLLSLDSFGLTLGSVRAQLMKTSSLVVGCVVSRCPEEEVPRPPWRTAVGSYVHLLGSAKRTRGSCLVILVISLSTSRNTLVRVCVCVCVVCGDPMIIECEGGCPHD